MLDRNKTAMSAIIKLFIPESCTKAGYFEDWIDDDSQGNVPFKIASSM